MPDAIAAAAGKVEAGPMRGTRRRPDEIAKRERREGESRKSRSSRIELVDQRSADGLNRRADILDVCDRARRRRLRKGRVAVLGTPVIRAEEPSIAEKRERCCRPETGEPPAVAVRRYCIARGRQAERGKVRLAVAAA